MSVTVACGKRRHWPACPGFGVYRDEHALAGERFECDCICHTTPEEDAEIDRLELEIMYGRTRLSP